MPKLLIELAAGDYKDTANLKKYIISQIIALLVCCKTSEINLPKMRKYWFPNLEPPKKPVKNWSLNIMSKLNK